MVNFSSWSIRNPIPTVMFFALLTFGGLVGFKGMQVQNFPDIDLPTVSVSASLPGAAPAQLETDVARKLENSIASVQGLRHITTTVVDGVVTINAEFRLEKPVQEAVDDVRSAVQRVRADLPSDLRDPVVNKVDMAGQPVLAYTIASPAMDAEALSWFVDNDVSRKLLAVKGVGAVNRVGGVTREVRVAIDALKVQALGITAGDVSRQLRLVQAENAGGRMDLAAGEQPVRTIATVHTAAELGRVQIPIPGGRRVELQDIATVSDTTADRRAAALLNGRPVVGFEIARSKGESEVEVGKGVRKALDELKAARPDIELTLAFDFVSPVEQEYEGSMHLLYEGAILAVVVVWLFLRDWRATIVSAVALPMSVIPAFIGMYLFGFSINTVTMLALSLVVGILVDDAIVEVENIVRHLRMGKRPHDAAMEAADEIGLAVIATTFALIAVFLPTAFMSGIAGKFFKQFGWTAALAVFASLVVARMLTPMMAAYILRPSAVEYEYPKWMPAYQRIVRWALQRRVLTCVLAGLFFVASVALTLLLPKGFVPADNNSQTQVYLELAPGATLAQTEHVAEEARLRISNIAHVKSVYTTIGSGSTGADPLGGGGSGSEVRKATLTVQMDPRRQRPEKRIVEGRIRQALSQLAGVRFKVGLGGSGEKYMLSLSGDDPEVLQDTARKVEQELRTIPGLGSIASSASLLRPEVVVHVDFDKAADLGVTGTAISEALRISTVGDYDQALAKLNLAQRQIPIKVQLQQDARKDLSVVERLTVQGARGPVMLQEVASFELSSGPALINRYDRSRNVNFEIELAGRPLGDVTEAVQALPSLQSLPPGVHQANIGDAELMGELFASFGLAMITGVMCIYVVLVLLFKHFLHPFTILAAFPLAIGGAFVGLLAAREALTLPALIGLIMLMGIATKNSILLVEYAIVAREQNGMSRLDALMDACHKRARPIIMTSIAMGAGMLPIALGTGAADPSFRSPMAIAVIGGLITSTLLSLVVIPVIYTLIDDLEGFAGRLLGRPKDTGGEDIPATLLRDGAARVKTESQRQ